MADLSVRRSCRAKTGMQVAYSSVLDFPVWIVTYLNVPSKQLSGARGPRQDSYEVVRNESSETGVWFWGVAIFLFEFVFGLLNVSSQKSSSFSRWRKSELVYGWQFELLKSGSWGHKHSNIEPFDVREIAVDFYFWPDLKVDSENHTCLKLVFLCEGYRDRWY